MHRRHPLPPQRRPVPPLSCEAKALQAIQRQLHARGIQSRKSHRPGHFKPALGHFRISLSDFVQDHLGHETLETRLGISSPVAGDLLPGCHHEIPTRTGHEVAQNA